MNFSGLCPRLGLSSPNYSEHRSTRLLRILQLLVVLRTILLCGICALAGYCWFERIECSGLEEPITTWASVHRSVLAMVLAIALVFLTCVVHYRTSNTVIQIIYKDQHSLLSLRWLAMETFGFLLFSAYGFLQMKIFGPMLSFNISDDLQMFNGTASVDTICATVERQQMVRLPKDWNWKPVAAFSLLVVPMVPFLLFAVYHTRWRRAKKMHHDNLLNLPANGNAENVGGQGVVDMNGSQQTLRVRPTTETDSWETIPHGSSGLTISTQYDPPPEEYGLVAGSFDPPPSYESVTNAVAGHALYPTGRLHQELK
ncbi:hypothetical protein RvY_16780 [Ramazzottius varieornatus]|uniref:Uncharacterized protein n=1 Tax=Ramazzottius varieornatus TaxID=947166 RepID=A0A1D1VZR4_RAMVA|nr:hypothetical protein RvY_16780 [Ramazzottius varieornatus]